MLTALLTTTSVFAADRSFTYGDDPINLVKDAFQIPAGTGNSTDVSLSGTGRFEIANDTYCVVGDLTIVDGQITDAQITDGSIVGLYDSQEENEAVLTYKLSVNDIGGGSSFREIGQPVTIELHKGEAIMGLIETPEALAADQPIHLSVDVKDSYETRLNSFKLSLENAGIIYPFHFMDWGLYQFDLPNKIEVENDGETEQVQPMFETGPQTLTLGYEGNLCLNSTSMEFETTIYTHATVLDASLVKASDETATLTGTLGYIDGDSKVATPLANADLALSSGDNALTTVKTDEAGNFTASVQIADLQTMATETEDGIAFCSVDPNALYVEASYAGDSENYAYTPVLVKTALSDPDNGSQTPANPGTNTTSGNGSYTFGGNSTTGLGNTTNNGNTSGNGSIGTNNRTNGTYNSGNKTSNGNNRNGSYSGGTYSYGGGNGNGTGTSTGSSTGPKTGDSGHVGYYLLMMILAAGAVLGLKKKKAA
ncbi:MAG: LPXTG cell wall anchor domain-containing protein [Lachnospiraceae bacterium]|nr:LPXTG cell wall anchor domain-containing protein [Candidatus Equihabitans merdae]